MLDRERGWRAQLSLMLSCLSQRLDAKKLPTSDTAIRVSNLQLPMQGIPYKIWKIKGKQKSLLQLYHWQKCDSFSGTIKNMFASSFEHPTANHAHWCCTQLSSSEVISAVAPFSKFLNAGCYFLYLHPSFIFTAAVPSKFCKPLIFWCKFYLKNYTQSLST